MKKRILLLGAAALAAGATIAAAMMNGEPADPEIAGVVRLHANLVTVLHGTSQITTESGCSGSLLSTRWVLTARHCVDPVETTFNLGQPLLNEFPSPWTSGQPLAAVWDVDRAAVAGSMPDPQAPLITRPALWALERSGAAPTGFGEHGGLTMVTLPGIDQAELTAIAQTPGGYVAGGWAEVGGVERMLVLRFDRAGHLLTTPFPVTSASSWSLGFTPAPAGRVRAIAVDPTSHDVIVVGTRLEGGVARWTAARFGELGAVTSAYAYVDAGAIAGELLDVAIVQGKAVVLGRRDRGDGDLAPPALAILDDSGFAAPPRDLAGTMVDGEARALSADGVDRVVVVGQDRTHRHLLAERYQVPALTLDDQYGDHGVADRALELTPQELDVVDAAVDARGGVVIGLSLHWLTTEWSTLAVARFTAEGAADPAFGQTGLVFTYQTKHELYATAMALLPEHALVVGITPYPRSPVARLFKTTNHDQPDALHVHLGSPELSIAHVWRHPDASVDVALLELSSDVPAASVRFAGFADPRDLRAGQPVVCYGYGGTGEALMRGTLLYEGRDDRDLFVVQRCPGTEPCDAATTFGDSGGACYLDEPSPRWVQLGVISHGDESIGAISWSPRGARGAVARGDQAMLWVAAKTGLSVIPSADR
jgi:hypothetical protein